MNDDDPPPSSLPEDQVPPEDRAGTKSRGSPLVYLGIGCGGLAVLAVIGFVVALQWGLKTGRDGLAKLGTTAAQLETAAARAAAELAIGRDSDLELISSDDATGAVTFRNKKTRQTGTVSYQEAAQGKFTIDPGKTIFKAGEPVDLPAWVPAFPGLETREGSVRTVNQGLEKLRLRASSDQPVDIIAAFYNKRLEEAGFTVTGLQQTAGEFATRVLQARDGTGLRSATISITHQKKNEPTAIDLAIEGPVAEK